MTASRITTFKLLWSNSCRITCHAKESASPRVLTNTVNRIHPHPRTSVALEFGTSSRRRSGLSLHSILDFIEVPRAEIVSVHPNIHRKRSIGGRQFSVGVPIKVPGSPRRLIPNSHRIVAKDDSLSVQRHLCEIIEPRKFPSQLASFFVMVSGECKYLLAANLCAKLRSSCLWADAEISEKVQDIVRFYTRVHAFQNPLIHFLDSLERAIAVSNDVLVPQMKVSGEPNVEHSSLLQ